ncbi:class I SAM-dependent methyltransferase [Anaerosporobacter sp.]
MNNQYEKAIEAENNIYRERQKQLSVPNSVSTGWEQLDKALDWLCDGTDCILDFGCGIGSLLFFCAKRGTKNHFGIDFAVEGIKCAKLRSDLMDTGEYRFYVGSLEQLQKFEDNCMDAIILSNVIDNMYPVDGRAILKECKRILKTNGKLMIKLNPYLTNEQLQKMTYKELEQDVYDDGFILWNRKTTDWEKELCILFTILDKYEFYIPELEQVNRIFLLSKC